MSIMRQQVTFERPEHLSKANHSIKCVKCITKKWPLLSFFVVFHYHNVLLKCFDAQIQL